MYDVAVFYVLEFREVVAEAFEGGAGEGGGAEEAAELTAGDGLPVYGGEGVIGAEGINDGCRT